MADFQPFFMYCVIGLKLTYKTIPTVRRDCQDCSINNYDDYLKLSGKFKVPTNSFIAQCF